MQFFRKITDLKNNTDKTSDRQQAIIDLYMKLNAADEEVANGAEGEDFYKYARRLREKNTK